MTTTRIALNLGLGAALLFSRAAPPAPEQYGNTRGLLHQTQHHGARKGTNPFPATDENIHAGQKNFSSYCISCHGLDGQNTGVPFADKMSPPVPSLNEPRVQAYTDAQLKSVIDNGIFPSGMPASKER